MQARHAAVTAVQRRLVYYFQAMAVLAFAFAGSLAMAHLFGGGLRFLDTIPRSRWLSFAGGTSVAYIFVHLLPELAEGQRALEASGAPWQDFLESHVWLVALLGLVAFYGLERAAKRSRASGGPREGAGGPKRHEVFWLHVGSFAGYNVLIGYLLLNSTDDGPATLFLFWFAMLLHFVVNDYALRGHHRQDYMRIGRWVLAVAVIAGALLALAVEVSESWISVLLAFIGGGVVLNVMKEELPEERDSSFAFFAGGAASYTAVLLAV